MRKLLVLLTIGVAMALVAVAVSVLLRTSSRLEATDAMPCADLDGDGGVTQVDIVIVASYWGQTVPPAPPQADMNGDTAITTFDDLLVVAGQFGTITGCQDKPIGAKITPKPTPTPGPTPPPQPEMSLTVKSPGAVCDDPEKPTKCTVPAASQFILSVEVNEIPVKGYVGFQSQVVYGTLKYKPAASPDDEIVWPDSALPARFPLSPTGQEGVVFHASMSGSPPPAPVSTHTGNIVEITLNCPLGGSFKVALPVHALDNPFGAAFVDPSVVLVPPTTVGQQLVDVDGDTTPELVDVADTLDINCTGPTLTPTLTPVLTATPLKPKNTTLDVRGSSKVGIGNPVTLLGSANFLQDLDGDGRAGWSAADVTISWPLALGVDKGGIIAAGSKSNCFKTSSLPGLWSGRCLAMPDPLSPPSSSEEVAPVTYALTLNCADEGTHTVTVITSFFREDGSPVPPEKAISNTASAEITCNAPLPTPTPCPTEGCAPEMSLTLKSSWAFCDHPFKPITCDVPLGKPFILSVEVNGFPPAGYVGFQTQIDYGSLKYKPAALVGDEILWPESVLPVRDPLSPTGQEGVISHGGASAITPPFPVSTYLGNIVEIDLNCPATAQSFTISLQPFDLSTNPLGAGFKAGPEDGSGEIVPVSATLDINCVALPAPEFTARGPLALIGGKTWIQAGSTVQWICDSFLPDRQVVLRFQYEFGTQDIGAKGRAILTGVPEANILEGVECLVDGQSVGKFVINWIKFIDPSGRVYDTNTGDATTGLPVPGATVILERAIATAVFAPVPTDPALKTPVINPQTTGLDGRYAWDVVAGTYRVRVQRVTCSSATSPSVDIPPPVTTLHVGIKCSDTDGDTIPDFLEESPITGTDPGNPDTNGDTIPDGLEDPDGDGLNNLQELAVGTDPLNPDTDLDGCTDGEELGADQRLGGRRNPLHRWDFYDINGDKVVNIFDDIIPVSQAFGSSAGVNYAVAKDRTSALPGGDDWDLQGPDGFINVFADIFGVAGQFGHNCSAPPN